MEFVVLLQIMFYSFLIAFSGSITPGPVFTIVIKETPQRGWTTGPLVVVGHSILELLLIIGLVFGLDLILETSLAQLIICLIGGIVLCFLAALMLIDALIKKISITKAIDQRSTNGLKARFVPIFDGIITSISSPFWILWWATIGVSLIFTELPPLTVVPIEFGFIGLLVFYIGHIMADFVWYTFISVMIASGKKWINDKVYRIILVCCAAFLIYLGITFIINGLTI
ncbi:MAG: LysE family translocator [Candidatus Helarchaeota archaeon]|nr:LysE family translocator [Candidatus Helarchaeota archaeon]